MSQVWVAARLRQSRRAHRNSQYRPADAGADFCESAVTATLPRFSDEAKMARLLSVNVGLPRDIPWQGKTVHTGVWKTPVQGRRMVRRLNIDGDGQGDLQGHGGEHRAVFVYQIDSYRYWQAQLGRNDFVYGQFGENLTIDGLHSPQGREFLGDLAKAFDDEIELVRGATESFDAEEYRAGRQTPVFFGSAINNFGVEELLASFTTHAPGPLPRVTRERLVEPSEDHLTGFVFKIQANMDPMHRDRIAFLRLCSGKYSRGMRLYHTRLAKEVRVADALTFMAADRAQAEEAFAGDIIGLHNHGTINIGDTFTDGERLTFTGVPNFAPEIFRRAVLKDPLKMKALNKGLSQLCEEGATQLFKPLRNNDLILGAVGQLQFEVVAFRLQDEYSVQCVFDNINVHTARWITAANEQKLEEFRAKGYDNLAVDHSGALVYLAPSRVNLQLTMERWPGITFHETREHASD